MPRRNWTCLIQTFHQLYGEVCLQPQEKVVAGSYGTWTLTNTVGEKGVATGGADQDYTLMRIRIGRTPQMDDPAGADYLTIKAPKATRIGVLVQSVLSLVTDGGMVGHFSRASR